MDVPVKPSWEDFVEKAKSGNVVPVYAQLAADFETPVSAFLKIRDGRYAFLLESAENTDASGRWSIVGSDPRVIFESRGDEITVTRGGKKETHRVVGDVLEELKSLMSVYTPVPDPEAPPFYGGAVGYLGYDAVRQFEPAVKEVPEDDLALPEAIFVVADAVLVFDHKLRRLFVVANSFLDEHDRPEEAYAAACGKIAALLEMLERPLQVSSLNGLAEITPPTPRSNTTQAEYEKMVREVKNFIVAGDVFQAVPSQRFETDFAGAPIDLYRALRFINPSPYMFVFETPDFSLVGSSPEVHVKSLGGRIDIRPIAGTRWRGKTQEEDDALAAELLNDEKERAEHVMLIDLARNDVGRIAEPGSVLVEDCMVVERYSHVMHIVSNVSGRLAAGHSSYDVLRSTFPAGTVSGAPKIRAIQVINSLEKNKRGTYSGAVGYFAWDGSHDSCIALRTCLLKDDKVYIQAGAGVVADSDPTYEFRETQNKAAAMMRAVALAKTLAH